MRVVRPLEKIVRFPRAVSLPAMPEEVREPSYAHCRNDCSAGNQLSSAKHRFG
jgi:hypothetical protein